MSFENILKLTAILFTVVAILFILFVSYLLILVDKRNEEKGEFVLGLYKNQCKDCIYGDEYMCKKKQELLERLIGNHDERIENSCDKYIKRRMKWNE